MSIGANIKRLRKERKMTQEQLGNVLGVKKAAVQKYESGAVRNLKQDTIKKLVELFEVDPVMFVDINPLASQLEIISGIKSHFGDEAVELLEDFTNLDKAGRNKLIIYAKDMRKIYG